MTVSVVIATYSEDRWDRLVAAIDSALGQSPPPVEVVVVVDHNPALLERIEREMGESVVAVANAERQGLSGGRNTGAATAIGDIVVFLDDDARARPGWLAALATAFDDPTTVGAGGLTVPDWEAGRAPRWLPDEFLWVVGSHYRGHRTTRGPVRSPIGANMAFPRRHIEEMGGFSWRFSTPPFERCDETEFSIRLVERTAGVIEFIPDAIVDHWVSPDRNRWGYFLRRCMLEGRAKAALAAHAGLGAATGVERRYVIRTLGRGFFRYLGRGLTGHPTDFARAANVVVGLTATTLGFIQGRLSDERRFGHLAPDRSQVGPPGPETSTSSTPATVRKGIR